jgi:hypothetical protein
VALLLWVGDGGDGGGTAQHATRDANPDGDIGAIVTGFSRVVEVGDDAVDNEEEAEDEDKGDAVGEDDTKGVDEEEVEADGANEVAIINGVNGVDGRHATIDDVNAAITPPEQPPSIVDDDDDDSGMEEEVVSVADDDDDDSVELDVGKDKDDDAVGGR